MSRVSERGSWLEWGDGGERGGGVRMEMGGSAEGETSGKIRLVHALGLRKLRERRKEGNVGLG